MVNTAFDSFMNKLRKYPSHFIVDYHRITHTKSGVSICVCNGLWFYQLMDQHRAEYDLTFLQKIKFHFTYKKWMEAHMSELLEKDEE